MYKLNKLRLWYLLHMRAANAKTNLSKHAVSLEVHKVGAVDMGKQFPFRPAVPLKAVHFFFGVHGGPVFAGTFLGLFWI